MFLYNDGKVTYLFINDKLVFMFNDDNFIYTELDIFYIDYMMNFNDIKAAVKHFQSLE
jgi:hypothetical protein